jgi:hypothetical protein
MFYNSFEGREGLPIDKSFPTTALENVSKRMEKGKERDLFI